jgi:microcystin degradation protein MlrC
MGASGPWAPVPLRMTLTYPGGPVERAWFDTFIGDVRARMAAAGPLDGVFVCLHGAAATTGEDDPDARFLETLRQAVGPRAPIVAVVDRHTNVSARMCAALSGFVAYRTNPHVDLRERGALAARLMRTMLREGAGEVVLETLPMLPAGIDQPIAPGTPYHDLMENAQARVEGVRGGPVLEVSLCDGFPLADCARCGFSVVVTARAGQRAAAEGVAREVAAAVWARRHDFLAPLTPLEVAVSAAVEAAE